MQWFCTPTFLFCLVSITNCVHDAFSSHNRSVLRFVHSCSGDMDGDSLQPRVGTFGRSVTLFIGMAQPG